MIQQDEKTTGFYTREDMLAQAASMRVGTNLGVEDESQSHRFSIDDTGVIVGTIVESKTSDERRMQRYACFSPRAVSSR